MDSLGNAITGGLLEIVTAAALAVVTAIVGYVGAAAKRTLDSDKAKKYAEAVKSFDEDLYLSLVDIGAAVEETIADAASDFTESDRYELARGAVLDKVNRYVKKTGLDVELSESELDSVVKAAIREGKAVWSKSLSDKQA